MSAYSDFFIRSQDRDDFNPSLYDSRITSQTTDVRGKNLFMDCLANHVDFNSPAIDTLTYLPESNTRYITRDSITSYFISKKYEVPDITSVASGQRLEFEKFIADFVESSFAASSEPIDKFMLGTNRMIYVVGDVGEGKSAFIQKVISEVSKQQDELDKTYKLLPIPIDLEERYNYGMEPIPLKDTFLEYLFTKIKEAVQGNRSLNIDLKQYCAVNTSMETLLLLKELISYLKEQRVRLLIFIDNLDFYHYYYARYSFFREYHKRQELSVRENIMWLINVFESKDYLGQMGLNVMIAARKYVYTDIETRSDGTNTDIDTSEAVMLSTPSTETILRTRFKLLCDAIEVVRKNKPTAAQNLMELLMQMEAGILGKQLKIGSESPIAIIGKLGQHGNRSLVNFFSSLNISYMDRELIDRFFVRQVSSLYMLYFLNVRKKYTQANDHFPNLFLVDCTVMDHKDFDLAKLPHMHSYWLKYFVLALIVKKQKIKLNELMAIFSTTGHYDSHLVRHVVGSLCTANEFRCAEIDTSEVRTDIDAYKILPTERGKSLFNVNKRGVPMCMGLQYLELAIDCKWLSLPNEFSKDIFNPKLEYSSLYQTGESYITDSVNRVYEKAKSVLNFIAILEASYIVEIQENQKNLHSILSGYQIVPDFKNIRKDVAISAGNIISALKKNEELEKSLTEFYNSLNTDLRKSSNKFRTFFENYYKSGTMVSP